MREQGAALLRARLVLALAEEDVLAHRHRVRTEHAGEGARVAVGVQAYGAQVVAELLLQLPAHTGVQWLPGPADDVLRLGRPVLRRALLAFAAALGGGLLGRLGVLRGGGRHRVTSPRPASPACTARASS